MTRGGGRNSGSSRVEGVLSLDDDEKKTRASVRRSALGSGRLPVEANTKDGDSS